jgi:hypothetical protein
MRLISFLLPGILFFSLLAHAGTRHPAVSDDKHLEYGAKFHYVARLLTFDDENKPQFASAVLIRPNWALTAAHVVRDAKHVVIMLNSDQTKIIIERVIPHEEFGFDTKPGVNDIALCYSGTNFGLEFYPALYSDFDEREKVCSISGYGVTGTFETGFKVADTKRRAGSNKIDRFEKSVLICTPSAANRTALEFLISPGDSGGGLFIGNKLAGINSFIMCDEGKIPDSAYGTEAGHTRISLYYDWIHKQIDAHEANLKTPPPEQ